MYKLLNANEEHIEILKEYKLMTILEYAVNISREEKNKIINYIDSTISKFLEYYKLIIVDSKIVGCLLVTNYNDGRMLDEIYIEENYRNKGIGSEIIIDIIKNKCPIYLWVYKNNKRAIRLYMSLKFKIIQETETRYMLKYQNS